MNVLVYAHREDAQDHRAYRDWLEAAINAESAYGLSDLVIGGFVRVVTHPKIFIAPSSLSNAIAFATQLRDQPNRVAISPGRNHWAIFRRLCEVSQAKGNLIPDAYYAAMAIENGCEWITTDRDFSRFPDLRWRHPLAA
ncbi:MAG: type II toxin-antitoxin system VapC family toxin [Gammaproteobacteria bacterium]